MNKGWVGFVPWAWVSVTEVQPTGTEPWEPERTLQSSLRGSPALGGKKLCLLHEAVGPGVMRKINPGVRSKLRGQTGERGGDSVTGTRSGLKQKHTKALLASV